MESSFQWSDDQWNTVKQAVHDEAMRARVGASFLPLYGPLPADTQTVPKNLLEAPAGDDKGTLKVVDYEDIRLSTISVNVGLKNAQISDPELTSALMMFRRAAEVIARVEDGMVFNGQQGVGEGPKVPTDATPPRPNIFNVSGGGDYEGLADVAQTNVDVPSLPQQGRGEEVFTACVQALQEIETLGYYGPFAVVMGNDHFADITKPIPKSMVLPRDSLTPFLNGPLLRCSVLPPKQSVIVSLSGAPAEIVVPSDISVRYMTTTLDNEHMFRVQQKMVLRVKEPGAIATVNG